MVVNNAEYLTPFAVTLTRDEEADPWFAANVFRALVTREKYNVGTNIKAWLYTIFT